MAVIEELRALVAQQSTQLERQAARIAELELALAKAKKDSSTSSKPPSSDITKPKQRKPGRRKKPRQGGQPGHERQLREPLPPERVDETIEYEIDDGEVQRLGLAPTGDFEVIQHIELPDIPVHVTEHRLTVTTAKNTGSGASRRPRSVCFTLPRPARAKCSKNWWGRSSAVT
jgi:transposase